MTPPSILVVPTYLLIVDDDGERVNVLRDRLRKAFREHDEVFTLGSAEWLSGGRDLARRGPVQAILAGRWDGWERSDILHALAGTYPDVPVCFIDGEPEMEAAGFETPAGRLAGNPVSERLRRILGEDGEAGAMPGHAAEDDDPGGPDWLFRGMSGASLAIQNVVNDVTLVAASDSTVLITGADGTGKEIAARNIHFQSPRRLAPFVPVRCRAVPPDRLEVELFGNQGEAGAPPTRGRFEKADGGTLFLDEIAAMDVSMQLRLLRVLQDRTLELGGDGVMRHVNVRIVATTCHDLDELVADGAFREDLYDCLSVFPIRMPGMKERIEDLPVLIDEVQRKLQHDGTARMTLTAPALEALKRYPWPGNLRELSDLVEQLQGRHPGSEVDIGDLPREYRPAARARQPAEAAAESPPDVVDLERYLADVELRMIRRALADAGGVVPKAAERLKLKHEALLEKMRKYGI